MDFVFVSAHSTNACSNLNVAINERLSESDPSKSTLQSSTQSFPEPRGIAGLYSTLGAISAIISLFIVPEIFGAAAIILGAYAWKREQGNRGIYIVILGIVCMLVGLYFTAYFILGDLLPS